MAARFSMGFILEDHHPSYTGLMDGRPAHRHFVLGGRG
jgi:hypothetical protein